MWNSELAENANSQLKHKYLNISQCLSKYTELDLIMFVFVLGRQVSIHGRDKKKAAQTEKQMLKNEMQCLHLMCSSFPLQNAKM